VGKQATPDSDERVRDGRLVEQLRAGDELAYEALIRDFGGRMLAAARRILPTEEDAQDAVQEAFLSAFRKIDTFQGQSRLGTWLHRIAINAALMRLRSLRRRKEQDLEDLLPRFLEGGHFQSTPRRWSEAADEPAVRSEIRQAVRDAIDELPENYRIPLLLRDIEQLDNAEVADHLGISVNAAKIRVHRARLALRERLDPHLAEAEE
jgi:RNA polymerase sigma-70 factor (ECF subfamily)